MGWQSVRLLALLLVVKMVATGVTLGSGGSGGIIAPTLFVGATLGAVLGYLFKATGMFPGLQPELYALVGMGAVLAAVVHAPMASILICFELTQDYKVMLPAMLACIVAVAVARGINRDSIYTLSLRTRGLLYGSAGDYSILRQITIEQVPLDPVSTVGPTDPVQTILDLSALTDTYEFVVADAAGHFAGLVLSTQLNPVLMDREAVPAAGRRRRDAAGFGAGQDDRRPRVRLRRLQPCRRQPPAGLRAAAAGPHHRPGQPCPPSFADIKRLCDRRECRAALRTPYRQGDGSRLREPVTPVTRPSLRVGDGDDVHRRFLERVEDGVRKVTNDEPSNVRSIRRPPLRRGEDDVDRRRQRCGEPGGEVRVAGRVPLLGL